MRRLLFLILFPSALLAQTQSFTVAKIDTIKSKTDAQAVRVADSLTVSGKVTVSGNLAVDGDTISTDADLSINAAGGDMTFKGEIAEAAGWRVQTDSSSSNNSYRLFMAEDPNNLFGFSHIYAGAANPSFGGTAFTLATNTYYFIRHDNSATGSTVYSVGRASSDFTFFGNIAFSATGKDIGTSAIPVRVAYLDTVIADRYVALSTGSAPIAGNATLVAGTVAVSTTAATADCIVMLTRKTSGGTIGTAITYTISAGTSFTITSDNVLDTSTFSWFIVRMY